MSLIHSPRSTYPLGVGLAVATILLILSVDLHAWGNPTHFMMGLELSRRQSLPEACYSMEFILSNNAPDLFSVNGPEFAHSDTRFASLLLELAGDDFAKKAYAYGYLAHMTEDAVVHSEYLLGDDPQHRLKEMSISTVLYRCRPDLRDAGKLITVRYYPEMLIEASSLLVERYGEGRKLRKFEITQQAKVFALALYVEKLIARSLLLAPLANRFTPASEWMDIYDRSVDAAYEALSTGTLVPSATNPFVADDRSYDGYLAEMAAFGSRLHDLGYAELNESISPDGEVVTVTVAEDYIGNDLLADIVSSNEINVGEYRILEQLLRSAERKGRQSSRKELSLSPPYPNPFNSDTRFSIETEVLVDNIEISIVNTLGQRVSVIYAGGLTFGRHEFVWQGNDSSDRPVASGVYFVLVQGGSKALRQKMLLLK